MPISNLKNGIPLVSQHERDVIKRKLNIDLPIHINKQQSFDRIVYELNKTTNKTTSKTTTQHVVNIHSFFQKNKSLADKIALYVPQRSQQRPRLTNRKLG